MTPDNRDLQLNALLGITQAINNNLSEEDLFKIYKFNLLGDLRVKKMALFVRQNDSWILKVQYGSNNDWSDIKLDARFNTLSEATAFSDKEFMDFQRVEPILHKKHLLGLLFLGDIEDATFVKTLTNIIIVAVENKRLAKERLLQEAYKKELEIATKVQTFLFPKILPNTSRLRLDSTYLPNRNVGGDYYDFIELSKNRFVICVADVSGKGVPAALMMSNFQATLRVLVRRTEDLQEIVQGVNESTVLTGNLEHFITFFIAIYDFESASLEYVNCGHNPQYLIVNGSISELAGGTTILGMFDPLPFLETVKIENLKEFEFFGFTDGITETFNESDEPFGEERLEAILLGAGETNVLHTELLNELDAFRGTMPYGDDITMLSCKVVNS